MNTQTFQSVNIIRSQFSAEMSSMYKEEVPQYASLFTLVKSLNNQLIEKDPSLYKSVANELLECERHGAIRLGTADELSTMRRLFSIMGMYPVDYYDLSVAGIPVHSTAFRALDSADIASNPFRIFTSLLRLDLIDDKQLKKRAEELLSQRKIFSDELLVLIDTAEQQGGLDEGQTFLFVEEALETFRWQQDALVDSKTYASLSDAHRLIADVVSFKGPHINHLTPRSLDIDELQEQLKLHGFSTKAVVEGPPRRNCPILLRQTSFLALEEPIVFADNIAGTHTARFGEVEQRGVALTPKGRKLYDKLLNQARNDKTEGKSYTEKLEKAFTQFPDTHKELHNQGLAYYRYETNKTDQDTASGLNLEELISQDYIRIEPIVYEDFLPVSAAGIFTSNLDSHSNSSRQVQENPNQNSFEEALGTSVINSFSMYEAIQIKSLDEALKKLEVQAGITSK